MSDEPTYQWDLVDNLAQQLAAMTEDRNLWVRRADKTWHEKKFLDEIEDLRNQLATMTKERDLLLGTEILSAGSGIPRTDLQSAWEKFKPTATDNFTSFVAGWRAHSHFGPARLGDEVRKKSGSEWEGKVVGYYSTELTPVGVCVESNKHRGSVQIYPITALEFVIPHNPNEAGDTPRTPR